MLNIIDIQKKKKNNTLIVRIEVQIRKNAKQPVETLKTSYVMNELCKEYEIQNIISEPKHMTGNTKKSGIKQIGIWSFELIPPLVEKEVKKPRTRRRAPSTAKKTTKKSTTTTTQKKTFRNRISDIAKNTENNTSS